MENEYDKIINAVSIEIQNRILVPRVDILTNELEMLLRQEKFNICDNWNDFTAIQFEYDTAIDFCFVGYPTTELFDNWYETAIIELEPQLGNKEFNQIMKEFNIEQYESELIFSAGYNKMLYEIQEEFFSNCWKKAKLNTNSDKRCFLFVHDISTCWDCDLNERIHEREIKNRITDNH